MDGRAALKELKGHPGLSPPTAASLSPSDFLVSRNSRRQVALCADSGTQCWGWSEGGDAGKGVGVGWGWGGWNEDCCELPYISHGN